MTRRIAASLVSFAAGYRDRLACTRRVRHSGARSHINDAEPTGSSPPSQIGSKIQDLRVEHDRCVIKMGDVVLCRWVTSSCVDGRDCVPRNLTRPESQTCRHGWSPRDSGPPVQSGSPRVLGMRPHDHATAARIVFATGAWGVHLRLCLTYG